MKVNVVMVNSVRSPTIPKPLNDILRTKSVRLSGIQPRAEAHLMQGTMTKFHRPTQRSHETSDIEESCLIPGHQFQKVL